MKEVLFYQEVTVFDFAVKCVIVIGFIVIVIAQIIEYFKKFVNLASNYFFYFKIATIISN